MGGGGDGPPAHLRRAQAGDRGPSATTASNALIRAGGPVAAPVPPNPGPIRRGCAEGGVASSQFFPAAVLAGRAIRGVRVRQSARPPKGSTAGKRRRPSPRCESISRSSRSWRRASRSCAATAPERSRNRSHCVSQTSPWIARKAQASIPATLAAHHSRISYSAPPPRVLNVTIRKSQPPGRSRVLLRKTSLAKMAGTRPPIKWTMRSKWLRASPRASRSQSPAGTAEKV